MNPILLDLGFIKIYWYSIFIFLAIFLGGTIVLRESNKKYVEEDYMVNMFFWTIIAAFIGARLYYVAFNFEYYSNNLLDILKVWEGGLAIHGGLLFGSLVILIYTKKYNLRTLFVLDMIVVGLLLGQAIGRWGNFFNGEAHGGIISLDTLKSLLIPQFIIDGMNIDGNYYLPTFYFESIWCFIGFIILLFARRAKYIKVGQPTSLYLVWDGIGRAISEHFRTDSLMILDFKMAQIISILMIIIGIIMFIVLGRGSKFSNLYNEEYAQDINF